MMLLILFVILVVPVIIPFVILSFIFLKNKNIKNELASQEGIQTVRHK